MKTMVNKILDRYKTWHSTHMYGGDSWYEWNYEKIKQDIVYMILLIIIITLFIR